MSSLPVHRPILHKATAGGLPWLLGAHHREPEEAVVYTPMIDIRLKRRYKAWLIALEGAIRQTGNGS